MTKKDKTETETDSTGDESSTTPKESKKRIEW